MEKFIHFVINHWALWLALVVIIILLVLEEFKDKIQGIQRISPQDLTILLNRDQAIVIDVRDKTNFDKGHIIGAVNIPAAEIDTNVKKLEKYKDKKIVIVDGAGQANSLGKLRGQGFNLHYLAGGINSWKNAGLPLTKT